MHFLGVIGLLAATSMAAQVTVHNHCSTAVWLKADSAGATGSVSHFISSSIIKLAHKHILFILQCIRHPLLPVLPPFLDVLKSEKQTLTSSILLPSIPLS